MSISKRRWSSGLIALSMLLSAGCATTTADPNIASAAQDEGDVAAVLAQMMAGQSNMQGEELDAKIAEVSASPLGSADNPVRAQGPAGQRAYLSRLRCSDLSRTGFYRAGSAGISPYGNIVDVYIVTCNSGEPVRSEIYIDMYHRGHVEDEAVPGYGIAGGRSASQ